MANPKQQFQSVQVVRPPRSVIDGHSRTKKFTCDIGPLYPIFWQEILPDDRMKVDTRIYIRFEPLALPIMHEIEVYTHFFYVPEYMYNHNRDAFLIPQDNEGEGPGQNPIPIPLNTYIRDLYELNLMGLGELNDFLGIPPIQKHVYASNADDDPSGQGRVEFYMDDDSLITQFGKPTERADDQRVCLYPQFVYQLIYDCYYKAEKFVESMDFDSIADTSGSITQDDHDDWLSSLCTLRNRAWEKDLFTSCLPEPQKGTPSGINFDLNDLAVNIFLRDANTVDSNNYPVLFRQDTSGADPVYTDSAQGTINAVGTSKGTMLEDDSGDPIFINPSDSLVGEFKSGGAAKHDGTIVSNQLGFTIEEWRFAYGTQRFKEDLERTGSRLTEVIRSQFGVVPDDLTINRPRYLGGCKQMVAISEVLQQSETTANSALGEFAGHGYSISSSNAFRAHFNDYGIVMGIMSVRPRSEYGQGLPRYFTKFDRYDRFWPHLSHLGEQPIRKDQLVMTYSQGLVANPDREDAKVNPFVGYGATENGAEFGYQPIYTDYRFTPSDVAGAMRTDMADMHLNRMFQHCPRLNADFIEMNPRDFDHIFAVGRPAAGRHLLVEAAFEVNMIRSIPKYGNPSI